MAFAAEGMERSVAGTPAASMRRNASKADAGRPFWEKEEMRDDHAAGEGGEGRSRKARWERSGSAQRAYKVMRWCASSVWVEAVAGRWPALRRWPWSCCPLGSARAPESATRRSASARAKVGSGGGAGIAGCSLQVRIVGDGNILIFGLGQPPS
jgi:hypothetical protein